MQAFKLSVRDDGIAELIFDLPCQKVNVFSTPVIDELGRLVESLAVDDTIRLLTIKSAKKDNFIAGVDISELGEITDADDAIGKSKMGQELFNRIERLPFPTLCVIDGACMGGGLEMALACRYRIATDNPKTVLGLPEINLGIIPAWGGTQRLPRTVGLLPALEMILSGKPVDGLKAFKLKLVDGYYPKEFIGDKTDEFIATVLSPNGDSRITKARRMKRGIGVNLLERTPIGRRMVYSKAKKNVLKRTKGHYPAPLAALDVIRKSRGGSLRAGLKRERLALGDLAPGHISKNLTGLFYSREGLKKETWLRCEVEGKPVHRAAVLGSGAMGGGIAWLFSNHRIPVRMKDISWERIAAGYRAAQDVYSQLGRLRKVAPLEAELKMHYITGGIDYGGFGRPDLVVEAIVEDLEIKKRVLREVEEVVDRETIIASNTSSLAISDLASALKYPDRFIGMHFFNPVNRMPLVEVIAGEATSDETVATVVSLAKALRKTPIVVGDCNGFLVNRILVLYLNEAALLVEEGAGFEEIDRIISDFGMPMGPFNLMDEFGIDVGYKVATVLSRAYGDRMELSGLFHQVAEELKLLGKKGGKGFYVHRGKSKRPNPEIDGILRSLPRRDKNPSTENDILERCIYMMINEAARCLQENVIQRADYLDMALIMGIGFPPFRGGLLRYADEVGLEHIVSTLENYRAKHGERFKPAQLLVRMALSGERFYDSVQTKKAKEAIA